LLLFTRCATSNASRHHKKGLQKIPLYSRLVYSGKRFMRMRSNLEKTILLKNMVCGEEMEGNLTKGPILKTLTKLAIPIMASSFLGTLYNLTDMAWIEGSCRSWCRRNVHLAVTRTGIHGSNGRTSSSSAMYRKRK